MSPVRYVSLGPLLSGEGSRAFLGLSMEEARPPIPVVLIWAPQEIAQDADLTARLERETERALVFEHPNILRVHGLTRLDGGLARVTEFADGEPLRKVLEAHPRMPAHFAALVVADAAKGLHYAHVAGNDDGSPLVHGDIRPETLMVSFSGVTKVSGYGALTVAPRERGGKRVKNRRAYTAPEQLLGGREAVNVQSDVFLLGLTLHECLTGKMPFKESADPDKAVINRALPPMPNDVPLKLDAVVRRATSKRAMERYPSALAFREALVEAVGKLPSYESFAEYLAKLFPPESDARAARRQLMERGAAEALAKAGVPAPRIAELIAKGIGFTTETPGDPNGEPASGAVPGTAPVNAGASPTDPRVGTSTSAPVAGGSPGVSVPPASTNGSSAPASAQSASPHATGVTGSTPPDPTLGAGVAAVPVRAAGNAGAASAPTARSAAMPPVPTGGTPGGMPSAAPAARPWWPMVTVGFVLVAGAGAFVMQRTLRGTVSVENPPAQPPSPTLAVVDAGVLADAGAHDAGASATVSEHLGILDLVVEPRVDVSLNAALLGRTPLTVSLPPGRHTLTLTNGALGITVARTVTVAPTGKTSVQIYLNKAFVNVRAPEGASVTVDGRPVGTAPVDELDVYEGSHRLLVTVGAARWQKSFTLEAGQRTTFTVDFQEPPEE
ncbi:PEGA domain-containing protein [Corallococcus sp. M34]|uniref:serine/threonine-protein kinase n=1 Tax=Citreicoccus inhibens TaxID=2849499 RepID=UPI001C2351D1|nr:serine/threonine-protein kinase [Citreicoccus inhibens]MBU8897825.1 PEGA domain-containing protein [Citreicoccus inhibens]